MDEDSEIIAQSEKREVALQQLRDAVAACSDADLTRDEILAVISPLFTEDDIHVEGSLFDYLDDGEAVEVIRIVYGVLPEGGSLSFGVEKRSRTKILEICEEADIGKGNVAISREGHWLRVTITKLQ